MIRFLITPLKAMFRIAGLKEPQTFLNPTQLSKSQSALLTVIEDAVSGSDGNKITYHSEWLGYLPYGVYHWIEVNGTDISSQVQDMSNVIVDLQQLVSIGKLHLVKDTFDQGHERNPADTYKEFTLVKNQNRR